jgi:hypothetical protein
MEIDNHKKEELRAYINKMRETGQSDDIIAKSLQLSGWDEATVSKLLYEPEGPPTPPNQPPEIDSKNIGKWSTSAFFGTWVWLYYHKQNGLATKIFLFWLALFFINILPWITSTSLMGIASHLQTLQYVYLGVSIWLGIKGREIVWNSGVYQSVALFEEKQEIVVKWVVAYVLAFLIGSIVITGIVMKPYIDDPALMDQRIREEVYQEARAGNSALNGPEFYQGYDIGLEDGKISGDPKVNPTKSSSYKEGYRYGYMVSCMKESNSEEICVKKVLSALE